MTSQRCELIHEPDEGIPIATARAWLVTNETSGRKYAATFYICDGCRAACFVRGGFVPGAEIEVL